MTTLDLRTDAPEVLAMVADAVRRYTARHEAADTAGEHPPVTRIDLIFSLGDSGSTPWVHLHFDAKPGSEPDGDPTHPDFGQMIRQDWLPAVQAVCRQEIVTVVQPNGESRTCDDPGLTDAIGEFLVSMLLETRDTGGFADLPRGDRCELGVEDPMTGEFGWPFYEDRGQKNLVESR